MDFFEAQTRAKRRTNRLVFLFALAVLGTIAASYIAAVAIVHTAGGANRHSYYEERAPLVYWDPTIFTSVALATIAIVGLASLYKWSQMRAGGSAVAELVSGRRIDPHTTDLHERRLLNVVEEMAIASGTPVPTVYVLDEEPAINAFAAGLTTSDAVVAVTRGTLEKLTRDELQGVIGHEFSHILNGDMRLNVKLAAIVFGILVIGLLGRGILEGLGRGRVRSSGDKKGGGMAVILAIGVALLLIGYVGYFFGRLIQAAVSRQREFLADASAVQFTRNPAGLSGALKKIGGYALGSTLTDKHAPEIGHFFFAQGFTSFFGGLWATHPPLGERLRAIDPRWDGQLFTPPEVVDVATESFTSAGLAGSARSLAGSPPPITREIVREGELATPDRVPFAPAAVTASIGALTEAHFRHARALLETLPAGLRNATRAADTALPLIYGLLSNGAPANRERQLALIAQHSGAAHRTATQTLLPLLADLDEAVKLPLFQLCLPALRTLDAAALARFVATLDKLVHSDAEVSPFEFALQKMLLRQLSLARASSPRAPVQFSSFQPLAADIAVVLSALARAGATEPARVSLAFAAGVGQLPLIADRLALVGAEACTLEKLDAALDRLAGAALPIKQRVLAGAAQVIGADRVVTEREADLFRAIAAAIDCPVPVLAA
ncbi:MAG: M48 family metallopeptidase [Candidatus Didemnitutus sp.]|nr:M48 family metallopeptidase [Candidatus Didemnitutus sp.]